jgi:hypothetical protein
VNHAFTLFGLPSATAFYLALYMVTFVLHWIFVSYVLGGSLYLLVSSFGRRLEVAAADRGAPLRDTLRDWLPFALSAAITAGVAPLLFIQILYKKAFYTANLLLFHRWMALLPALIVGFYLTYLLKVRPAEKWCSWGTRMMVVTACACFLYTGYSWSSNHLLSLEPGSWAQFYVSGTGPRRSGMVFPRLVAWVSLAFAGMAMLLSWQVASKVSPADARRLSRIALAALVALAAAAGWYVTVDRSFRFVVAGDGARPWVVLLTVGFAVQAAAWERTARGRRPGGRWSAAAAFGLLSALLGIAGIRESARVGGSSFQAYFADHAAAAEVGGFAVFAFFAAFGAATIGFCLHIAHRREPGPSVDSISAGRK